MSNTGVERIVASKDVLVCAGSGGVGKTTTAAAIALGMARRGRKVLVLTIDPARRLADSLGIRELGNEPSRVEGLDGELWAMTLDAQLTLDELIERYAPDAAHDARNDPVYRGILKSVAGSQEYMAVEKLYELHESGAYDLIVLDTPPSRNALDFLDAPGRFARFIDSGSLQVLTSPGIGLFGRGAGALSSLLERALGIDLLADVAKLVKTFGGMVDGIRDRNRAVERLLRADRTGFVLITSPRAAAIAEAGYFHERLEEAEMPFGGVIVNRVRERFDVATDGDLERELSDLLDPALARKVVREVADHNRLAERDAHNLAALRDRLGDAPLIAVPELAGDVHDVDGLAAVVAHLF